MRPIRIKNIIFISAIIALFFVIPVSAYTSTVDLDLTPGSSWSNYYIVTCTGSISGDNVGNITSWEIDFDGATSNAHAEGSGTSISAASPEFPKQNEYPTPDEYDVTVTITYDGETPYESSQTIDDSVTIQEPTLVASIASLVPVDGTYTMTYSSDTDGADTYSWSFGDGNSSAESEGSYTYSAAGTYNVILTVTSEAGQDDDDTGSVTITAPTATVTATATESLDPTADFAVDFNKGSPPLYVRFTDESTENSVSDAVLEEWEWLFDYGSAGDDFDVDDSDFEDADTEYIYYVVDTYYPTLTVTDEDGYEDTYEYDCIEVVGVDDAPVAEFEIDEDYSDYGAAPLTVKFNDLSEESENSDSDLDEWYWEFYVEDNDDIDVITKSYTSSTDPVVELEDAGVYTVRLTVVDDDGYCSTEVKKEIIEVTSSISASFSASPTSGTVPLTVSFTASAGDYDIDEYYWNFGDGEKSSETDTTTSHTYSSAGTYKVTLTVYEGSKSYTTSAKTITVNSVSSTPAVTYPTETTATATQTEAANINNPSSSSGTKIFGLPGTEFFRSEMGRYYDFYKEWTSILAGIFGTG